VRDSSLSTKGAAVTASVEKWLRGSTVLRSTLLPSAITLALVAAVTAAIFWLNSIFAPRAVAIIYLVPVLFAATRWGLVPALVATVAGVACADFFFYPPIYSFDIDDLHSIVELLLFALVAVITSNHATRLKRQAEVARRHEEDTQRLYGFSRRLAVCDTAADIYAAIQDHLSTIIQSRAVLIGAQSGGRDAAGPPLDPLIPKPVRDEAAQILARSAPRVEARVTDASSGVWLVRAISPRAPDLGVIAIELGSGSPETIDQIKARVDRILVDATATLEHLDIVHAISEARLRAETNQLRDALIGSVSHELRTPLTSILGAATVLAHAPAVASQPGLASVAKLLHDEAERLGDIQNLIDASRITRDGIRPRLELSDPADVVNAALARKRRRLSAHQIELDVGGDLPLINIDPVLIVQALGQILDNAAKYAPAGSTITVSAFERDGQVVIAVRDQGVGLTADEQSRMWERFFRGSRHLSAVTGSGLGLWIAHAFVTANEGRIEAVSAGPGLGTTVSISLPPSRLAIPELVDGTDEENP
jgi:two-component system, OmpR family, sensor histidine kinase KdpD